MYQRITAPAACLLALAIWCAPARAQRPERPDRPAEARPVSTRADFARNDVGPPEGPIAGPGGLCPGSGSCCVANGTPGCSDLTCCEDVCFADKFCCDTEWDATCASLAQSLCDCSGTGGCPGSGSCCEANDSPGCDDAACCDQICAADPFCCDTEWDSECAADAVIVCESCATENCPGTGDCCLANPSPGCGDADCCRTVCESLPSCCQGPWTTECSAAAQELCGCTAPEPPVCPGGGGDCCTGTNLQGCEDECCCQSVCLDDPFCCETSWDNLCAEAAIELCPGTCTAPATACPGEGSCLMAGFGPGCDNESCCNIVCEIDAFCCETQWDSLCVEIAIEACLCAEPAEICPVDATGDCCFDNGTVGCDDASCCSKVCLQDPFCCNTQWDVICADQAVELCGCPACRPGSVSFNDPASGFIDARQPHPVTDDIAIQGVNVFQVSAPDLAGYTACWSLCESNQNPALHPPGLPPNEITFVQDDGGGFYTINLGRPITPGEVTKIAFTDETGTTTAVGSFIAHPGDVNGDGNSSPADILAVIDALNLVTPLPVHRTDADRSLVSGPEDILRVIDMLNGAGAFEAWIDSVVVDDLVCPQ